QSLEPRGEAFGLGGVKRSAIRSLNPSFAFSDAFLGKELAKEICRRFARLALHVFQSALYHFDRLDSIFRQQILIALSILYHELGFAVCGRNYRGG
ncbi:MAG: hypothetical protein QOH41_377, partial [Blastocatellia bacterium]|nr:hypothetical protein [Blastocatellia bacterium]